MLLTSVAFDIIKLCDFCYEENSIEGQSPLVTFSLSQSRGNSPDQVPEPCLHVECRIATSSLGVIVQLIIESHDNHFCIIATMSTKQLSQSEIWDDSALVDSWNEALEEYKVC